MKHLFKKSFMIALILLTLIVNAARVTPVQAASTWIVNTAMDENDHNCSDGDCSLRDAIELATAGDTITFDSLLSGDTIHLASTLIIAKNMTIDGSALAAQVSISGDTNGNGNPDLGTDVRVFSISPGVTATFESLTITRGVDDGGGVRNYGTLAVNNSNFTDNMGGDGGGILNYGTLTVTNTTFSGNTGGNGAAIFSVNSLTTITNSAFTANTGAWGAVDQLGSTLSVTGSTFTGNNVEGGGGVHLWSGTTATITDSAFSGNTANAGGAIRIEGGTATIANSTISGNTASWDGGGILVAAGTVTVVNSTIANNQATSPDRMNNGGGIWNQGTVNLYNITISGNNADDSGGGFYGGILNYTNTIIANSAFGGDCTGVSQINTNLNNLVENGSCSINGVNFIMDDPNLGALADNGGPTQTMALLFSSPALGAGDQATCDGVLVNELDQRGELRPQGDVSCDIGAFESTILAGDVPPALNSFTRQTPASSSTNADSLVFRAEFSEDVQNVDAGDFAVNSTSTATITDVSAVNASTYDITVSGGDLADFNGTVGLDLAGGQNIQDLVGNALPAGDPATDETYTVDNLAPDTSIDSTPNNPTNLTTAQFAFSSVDGGVSFECQLDSDGYTACISPRDYTNLASGSHTFYVRATDETGNTDPSPASYTWTVDTTTVYVNVEIGGEDQGTYTLMPGGQIRPEYDLDSGPVKVVSMSGAPIIVALRDSWWDSTTSTWTSFVQMMGLPEEQLSDAYYFPSYNNRILSGQLRFGNVDTVSTWVRVVIGGVERGRYFLDPNEQARVEYDLDSGPVVIESETAGVKIIAALRDAWWDGKRWTSFAQMMGLPKEQLSDSYYFPSYNSLTVSEQLRFGNVDTVSTWVRVVIGGVERGRYFLDPNEQQRVVYALDSGPVVIESETPGVKIIAALRDAWHDGKTWTSFAQIMGLPKEQLADKYYIPAYNNTTLSGQLRFGNVDTVSTWVRVVIGGVERGRYFLDPNEQARVEYDLDSGPVVIESETAGVKIIAALRDAWWDGKRWTSFSQLIGLPKGSLSTTYFLPSYNNLALSGQLRIGVP